MCIQPIGTAVLACRHGSTICVKGVKIPCGSWNCPECAKRKQIMLGKRVKEGFNDSKIRFCTLTARKGLSLAGMLASLKKSWNILRGHLVRKFGLTKFFWVLEFGHDRGRPHLHFLFNCYIPQRTLSKLALQSGFGAIVDIRLVKAGGGFGYVYKYLGKDCGSTAGATALRLIHGRRYGTSRNIKPLRKDCKETFTLGFFRDEVANEFVQESCKVYAGAFGSETLKYRKTASTYEEERKLLFTEDDTEELLRWARDKILAVPDLLQIAGRDVSSVASRWLIASEVNQGLIYEEPPF